MKKEEVKKSEHKSDNSFGVAAVILGICSIVFASVFYGLILGIIGLIFANKQQKISPNNWGKNGKILSIIGLILSILITALTLWQVTQNPQMLAQLAGGNNVLQ